ncbi:hypothetical protein ABPG77_004427, partial [Micractinium sp. CCAP 211/92]
MARLAVLAALLLVLGAAGCAAAATIVEVEHSLDGGKTYLPAGAITLSTSRKGATAVLERSPLSAEQEAELARLVAADGALYRLRLPASGVAAAFPARCLAAAAAPGGLELDLLEGGHVAAISVAAPCRHVAGAAPASLPLCPGHRSSACACLPLPQMCCRCSQLRLRVQELLVWGPRLRTLPTLGASGGRGAAAAGRRGGRSGRQGRSRQEAGGGEDLAAEELDDGGPLGLH